MTCPWHREQTTTFLKDERTVMETGRSLLKQTRTLTRSNGHLCSIQTSRNTIVRCR